MLVANLRIKLVVVNKVVVLIPKLFFFKLHSYVHI